MTYKFQLSKKKVENCLTTQFLHAPSNSKSLLLSLLIQSTKLWLFCLLLWESSQRVLPLLVRTIALLHNIKANLRLTLPTRLALCLYCVMLLRIGLEVSKGFTAENRSLHPKNFSIRLRTWALNTSCLIPYEWKFSRWRKIHTLSQSLPDLPCQESNLGATLIKVHSLNPYQKNLCLICTCEKKNPDPYLRHIKDNIYKN